MKIGIDTFDCTFGNLEKGQLYCVGCTAQVKRINLIAQVAIGLLSQQPGLAILSLDYSRSEMIDELKACYHTSEAYSTSKLSLWLEHQPITTYSLIQDMLQRITNKNILRMLIIDNLIKIRTDFLCPSMGMSVAANLYLLKMLAMKYEIPIIAFAELYPDKSLLQPLADSEYIDKMIIYHVSRERVPKPIRYNATTFCVTPSKKETTQFEIPFSIYSDKND